MKPTELQKQLCNIIKEQASFWSNTNDIHSPTHYCDIEESVRCIEQLSEEAQEQLILALESLYHIIKITN